jgi:pyrimidine deaminase RibD-like protein
MDLEYTTLAILEAKKCTPVETAFNVGAILVSSSGKILSTGFHHSSNSKGYSRELPGNTHAEQCCLLKLSYLASAKGATIYSTMEPCGERLSGNPTCALGIRDAGISRVVIGVKEPDNFISSTSGLKVLMDAGIEIEYCEELREACLALNRHL